MKKINAIISTSILCFLFWIFYTQPFDFKAMTVNTEEIVAGIVVSVIIGAFSSPFLIKRDAFWLFNPKRFFTLIAFIPVYAVELWKANVDVAKRALSKDLKINPGIVKIETEIKSDYGLAMLANCITLTPGTITMDIVEEKGKCYMYIHWIDVATQDVKKASGIIKGAFEPWVRRIFE